MRIQSAYLNSAEIPEEDRDAMSNAAQNILHNYDTLFKHSGLGIPEWRASDVAGPRAAWRTRIRAFGLETQRRIRSLDREDRGTSMACPLVAGSSALIVDWWRQEYGGDTPSPAMVKALLINGSNDMVGGNRAAGRAKDVGASGQPRRRERRVIHRSDPVEERD